MNASLSTATAVLALTVGAGSAAPPIAAQSKTTKPASTQKIDEEYTRLIRENLQDPPITIELVDHLPASDTVPSPLKIQQGRE